MTIIRKTVVWRPKMYSYLVDGGGTKLHENKVYKNLLSRIL